MEIEYDKESIDKIKKMIEEQYWKLLAEDLKVYPPDTKHLLVLIDEIKDIIYLLLIIWVILNQYHKIDHVDIILT